MLLWTTCNLACRRRDITKAQLQLGTFMAAAPAYPSGLFEGKGIVIMAGGLTYFPPAWVNIHMLRKAGESVHAQRLLSGPIWLRAPVLSLQHVDRVWLYCA